MGATWSSIRIFEEMKTYYNEKLGFEIKIPEDILNVGGPQLGGAAGQVVKIAQVVTGGGSSTKWHLQAKLDIPRGIDIRKDVDITIG